DHIHIAVSDLNRSERFYDRMMKHCTFEMRYPPMTKHPSSSSFKACCSILALLMSAASLSASGPANYAGLALEHEALGYQFTGAVFTNALNGDMSWAGGAGALYSTVEDLFRWK